LWHRSNLTSSPSGGFVLCAGRARGCSATRFRRKPAFGSLLGLLSCLVLVGALGCEPQPTTKWTSEVIILISIDTLRADYLGAYGYTDYPSSPFLDEFASENILFENSIVVEPRTLTSHMSLMTGLYPHHHQVQEKTVLPDGIPTLASLLQEHGYLTQAYTDGGYMNKRWGIDRGFSGFAVREHGGFQKTLPEAMKWIAEHDTEKLFLFLHTYDVHNAGFQPRYDSSPRYAGLFSKGIASSLNTTDDREFFDRFTAKQGALTDVDRRYIRATYAEGVRLVDDALRRFFAFLKRKGLYDRSIIIVWSDHGEGLYDHENWSHGEVFEHTIRVPLLVKIPGFEREGVRIRSVVSGIDLAPTILELANVPIPSTMDGDSLLPLLENDTQAGEAFSVRAKHGTRLFSIRTERYHYIRNEETDEIFFFDIKTDPKELKNLSPSGTPEERDLAERITRRIREHDDAWSRVRPIDERPHDSDLEEKLKALGYVN